MFTDTTTAVTIFGMAAVTYFTRSFGFFVVSRIKVSARLERFINAIPGTVLVSIVAPTVFASGPAELAASLATVVAAWKTKSLPFAMATGIILVWFLRKMLA